MLRTGVRRAGGLVHDGHVAAAVGLVAGDGGHLAGHVRLPPVRLAVRELVHVVARDRVDDLRGAGQCERQRGGDCSCGLTLQ